MGGRLKREGMYLYLPLIHTVVQQKLTQHCKAVILKKKKKKNQEERNMLSYLDLRSSSPSFFLT